MININSWSHQSYYDFHAHQKNIEDEVIVSQEETDFFEEYDYFDHTDERGDIFEH